jgi:hypothetical protein
VRVDLRAEVGTDRIDDHEPPFADALDLGREQIEVGLEVEGALSLAIIGADCANQVHTLAIGARRHQARDHGISRPVLG